MAGRRSHYEVSGNALEQSGRFFLTRPPKIKPLECDWQDFVEIHAWECAGMPCTRAAGSARSTFIAQLHSRMTDHRHLYATWQQVAAVERQKPGITGLAPAMFLTHQQVWAAAGRLQDQYQNRPKRAFPELEDCWPAFQQGHPARNRAAAYLILGAADGRAGLGQSHERTSKNQSHRNYLLQWTWRTSGSRMVWVSAAVTATFESMPQFDLDLIMPRPAEQRRAVQMDSQAGGIPPIEHGTPG